jgi:hypothetical protein
MPASICLLVGRWSIVLWLAFCLTIANASGESPPTHEFSAGREISGTRAFSADIVVHDAAGAAVGIGARIYVANRQVRIETPETPSGFFLIDGTAGTALFVRPTQQLFTDAKRSTRLTQIFVPVDPKDPCRQWQAAAKNAGVPGADGEWRCGRADTVSIDPATAGDRRTVEYRVVSPDQNSSQRWIDSYLEFPVKVREADGMAIELQHIRVEAQPANLFALPAGYHKSDPRALIDRIKHSDVWAGGN